MSTSSNYRKHKKHNKVNKRRMDTHTHTPSLSSCEQCANLRAPVQDLRNRMNTRHLESMIFFSVSVSWSIEIVMNHHFVWQYSTQQLNNHILRNQFFFKLFFYKNSLVVHLFDVAFEREQNNSSTTAKSCSQMKSYHISLTCLFDLVALPYFI